MKILLDKNLLMKNAMDNSSNEVDNFLFETICTKFIRKFDDSLHCSALY